MKRTLVTVNRYLYDLVAELPGASRISKDALQQLVIRSALASTERTVGPDTPGRRLKFRIPREQADYLRSNFESDDLGSIIDEIFRRFLEQTKEIVILAEPGIYQGDHTNKVFLCENS